MILIATHRGDCPMTRAASNIRRTVRSRSIIHRPAFENGELCVYLVLASSRRSRSRNPSRIPRRTIRRPVNGSIAASDDYPSAETFGIRGRERNFVQTPSKAGPIRSRDSPLARSSVSNRSLIEHFSLRPPPETSLPTISPKRAPSRLRNAAP